MSGGFCIYIEKWQFTTDPNNPYLPGLGSAGVNVTTQQLGISCSIVKSTTGPQVNQIWNSPDFRSFWLPVGYKTQLDAGTLNLFDDTDATLQTYRMDNKSQYRGLQYWHWAMSGSGMLISDKYELKAQTSYATAYDYRFSYGE